MLKAKVLILIGSVIPKPHWVIKQRKGKGNVETSLSNLHIALHLIINYFCPLFSRVIWMKMCRQPYFRLYKCGRDWCASIGVNQPTPAFPAGAELFVPQ